MMIRGREADILEEVEVVLVGLFIDLLVRPLICKSSVLKENGVLVEVEVDGLGRTRKRVSERRGEK